MNYVVNYMHCFFLYAQKAQSSFIAWTPAYVFNDVC